MRIKSINYINTITLVILLLLPVLNMFGQSGKSVLEDESIIQVATNSVSFSLRATDRKGRVIPIDPKTQNLKVVVDGSEQSFGFEKLSVRHFFILVDTSSSMLNAKISKVIEAVSRLVKSGDDAQIFSVYSFSNQLTFVGDFKNTQSDEVKQLLSKLKVNGETALYDAVRTVLKLSDRSSNSNALIIFTDGQDSVSKTSDNELKNLLGIRKSLTYLIVLASQMACREDQPLCMDSNESFKQVESRFQDIFQSVFFLVKDKESLYKLAKSIPAESGLLNVYFNPTANIDQDGEHQIKVLINDNERKLNLIHRQSYFQSSDRNLNAPDDYQAEKPLSMNRGNSVVKVNFNEPPPVEVDDLINEYKEKPAKELIVAINAVKPDRTSDEAIRLLPAEWQKLIKQIPNPRLQKVQNDLSEYLLLENYKFIELDSPSEAAISDSNVLILITSGMLKIADDTALEALIIHELTHGVFVNESKKAKISFNEGLKENDPNKMEAARKILAQIEIKCDLTAVKLLQANGNSPESYFRVLELLKQQEFNGDVIYHPKLINRIQAMKGVEQLF